MVVNSKKFLLITTLLVPVLVALLGFWQWQRGIEYQDFIRGERAELGAQLDAMRAAPAPEFGGINTDIQFQADGNTYVGDFALTKMEEALGQLDLTLAIATYRQVLPPLVIGASLAVLLIGASVLVAAVALAFLGTRSRPALLANFSAVRRLLPTTLIAIIVLTCLAVVSAILFETAALINWRRIGSGQVYLAGIALGLVAIALLTAWQALAQLRRFSLLFEPEPFHLIAAGVSRQEAPGLWALVDNFARRLGAPVPDTIALGVTQGFFVVSGPVILQPAAQAANGNTLHVPLGMLALMRVDEVATIIGHELAHFAGDDTLYSQKFLPIYNGFSRSLDAVAAAGRARDGSLSFLSAPALALGYFVLERFHLAVQHWSRIREFEADRLSATLTSPEAAGRALLRHGAVVAVVDEVTNYAWTHPDRVGDDLVGFLLQTAAERGLDDPSEQEGAVMAHPTDSHPHNTDRLAAFAMTPTPERIAAARALPTDAHERLGQYFADVRAVCREVTGGLLAASQNSTTQRQETLSAMATAVGEEAVELYENTRPIAIFMFVIALPLLAIAAWTFVFGLPGFGSETIILVVAFGLCGGFVALMGWQSLQRARIPAIRLFPDRFEHRHLDRPIYWNEVRDLSVVNQAGTMVTTFLLKRSAAFPRRIGGRGRIILNPGAWMVTIRSVPPQHYKARGYIELIGRYADAAAARNALAQSAASTSALPVPGDS